jgi:hypothetical protein
MTPARLAEILDLLRWSAYALAAETRVNDRTVRRWLAGDYPIPETIEHWLERLAAAHADLPAPPAKRKNISRQHED